MMEGERKGKHTRYNKMQKLHYGKEWSIGTLKVMTV